VDPVKAFQTHESLKTTLQRLQDGGIEYPWVIPTHRTRMTLHNVAAWVWGAGGDFISADGVHVTFQHPKALEGFRQYFELAKFIASGAHELDDTQSDAMFWQGKSAVTISGPWLLRTPGIKPEVLGNIGVTFPPGIPWFGGSNLVIWQYSTHIRESLAFIRFITSKQVRETFMSDTTMLPVRRDVLDSPSFADPRFEYLRKGLQTSRAFYLIHNWGMVEDRLSSVLSNIWTQIVQTPDLDLPALLEQELSNLARRLELAIGG
jgi:multiple sugar transport system substrate-binding protein